jgi:outer membrane receptor protein involved in Fe transport
VRWIDERIDLGQELAPYTTVDASVWTQILRDLRASLRVDNVLDADYRSRAGLLGEGRRFTLVVEGVWR